MKINTLTYRVNFITPAFLGNAWQKGQWRTPPFKALLRQWWRVVYAKEVAYNWEALLAEERRLFGSASDDSNGKSGKSRVRLRLEEWVFGKINNHQWPGGKLNRVVTTRDGKGQVRSDVYLGFGAILPPSKKQKRKSIELANEPAIDSNESVVLSLRVMSSEDMRWVNKTIQLAQAFGTIGSRSRNGWGSFMLEHIDGSRISPFLEKDILMRIVRPINECFSETWPHAIGLDENNDPLIWISSQSFSSWHSAIDFLAQVKVAIRRIAKNYVGNGIGGIHLLGYPAGGKWKIKQWEGNDKEKQKRFACPLRFKVVENSNGKFNVVAVHLPHSLPDELTAPLNNDQRKWLREKQPEIWKNIHGVLDKKIERFGQERDS